MIKGPRGKVLHYDASFQVELVESAEEYFSWTLKRLPAVASLVGLIKVDEDQRQGAWCGGVTVVLWPYRGGGAVLLPW